MIKDEDYFPRLFSVHDEDPLNPAMDKKLVINVAPTGAFVKREQNPNQAYTPKEVARQVIDAYKVGASIFHVHVRDEKGVLQPRNIPAIKETLDRILDECPDMIMSHSGHIDVRQPGKDGVRLLVEPLIEAGLKAGRNYVHMMVLSPTSSPRMHVDEATLKEKVSFLQENGVKPEFQISEYRGVANAERWLIRPGILKKPYIMNILSGIHGTGFTGPTQPDPWGQMYLTSMLMGLKHLVPGDGVIGATVGGHSWLPITVWAIMMGADCVRIGMEDTIWLYPHKHEKISSCAQVVNKIATITKELGREIATPSEARAILGVS